LPETPKNAALPHENLPFFASSISFPPIRYWSLLQDRNVALQDAISPYKSARSSEACRKYELTSCKRARSNGNERIEREGIYQRRVFFIEHLGFCQPTEARKITFEESLVFEKIHEETYTSLGYDLLKIAPEALWERVHRIMEWTWGDF
jgi:predicted ATPase